MAEYHDDGAQRDGIAPAQPPVGDQPAQHRRQVGKAVEPDDDRRQAGDLHRAIDVLKGVMERLEADDLFDMTRQQQPVRQVQRQQGGHAVIGKPFERLGENQENQAERVAEKGLFALRRMGVIDGHEAIPVTVCGNCNRIRALSMS